MPDLTYCQYETYVDSCTGEEDMGECYAYITVGGTDYEDWCDVLDSYFTQTGGDCVNWDYQGPCGVDGLDVCYAEEGFTCDTAEYVCNVEWSYEGIDYTNDCDSFDLWLEDVFYGTGGTTECVEWYDYDCTADAQSQFDSTITYCYQDGEWDNCLEMDVTCNLYVEIDDMVFEGTCDQVITDLGWDVDDGTGGGEVCAIDGISENCWDTFSAEMPSELDGIVTDCHMSYEWDTCTGDQVYCWIKLEVEGVWQEGFCDTVDQWLDFGGTITDECAPDEVRPESESGDCLVEIELSGDYVPGLEACQYQATYDACTG